MIIETLEKNVIAQLRSTSAIDSVTQCVTELVLNSLDAKSTSIAVRVNLTTLRIQVVDNGRGISRSNLDQVGQRYMTNKCHSLKDLCKNLKYYGFKGEALANVSKISHRVTITTRDENSEETYEKIIANNSDISITLVKSRPSCGTTVTVEGFLSNLPVRRQCIKNNELDNIKKNLESLIIIHPRVSLTLRNDVGSRLLLASTKCRDIANSFKTIHPEIDEDNFALLKVTKNRTSLEGLIYKDFHDNKRLQYIYVNKRPIHCPKLQILINTNFQKSSKNHDKKKYPVFVIHIKCPYSDVDITLEPTKTVVYFKKYDIVKRCVEKMLVTFLGAEKIEPTAPKTLPKVVSEFGISQIGGAVKGFGAKRKSDEMEEVVSNKSAKIIEETPFFEEPKVASKTKVAALPIEIKKNEKNLADNSLFTNFPENEKKGKDVIMDMFIMSLKVFTPEEDEEEKKNCESCLIDDSDNNNKLVQTSFDNGNDNKVSVGIQTSPTIPKPVIETDVTFVPRKPLTKFVSDYNFDFSKIDTFPVFSISKKYDDHLTMFNINNQTKKLFDFCGNYEPTLPLFGDIGENSFSIEEVIESPPKEKKITQRVKNDIALSQSPYFLKKPKRKFKELRHPELAKIEMSFGKNVKMSPCLNESLVSRYFSTPKRRLRPKPIKTENFEQSEDLFQCSSSNNKSLEDFIRDENDKESQNYMLAPTLTLPQDNWVKEVNEFGNTVYTNTKTGIKTLRSPKKDMTFEMTDRFDFVPKGLSPILKDHGQVDAMTPESRQRFQNAIIQSYEDELLVIKWQNDIDDHDPKKFFEQIYLEKSKLIESCIPSITKRRYAKHAFKGFENMSFTKDVFNNLVIIGQVDCKFIAVLDKTKRLILLFDQHAVHERVRLEELSEGYKNTSTKLDQNITMFVPYVDLKLLKHQKTTLKSLGIKVNFFTNGLSVSEVPLCIYNKSKKGVDIVSLTGDLIKEITETLKINNGILVNTPKIIQNIVNSEACRGAIKFGDSLTKNECLLHLKNLSQCKLPFQCAHGRPTLTPLLVLGSFYDTTTSKPDLGKLKMMCSDL